MPRQVLLLAGLLCTVLLGSAAHEAAQASSLLPAAVVGADAPNGPAFDYVVLYGRVAVADTPVGRRIAFTGRARQPRTPVSSAITKNCLWVDDTGGGGTVIACMKDTTPDGRLYRTISIPTIGGAGRVVWTSTTSEEGAGVYSWNGTTTSIVARNGDATAGAGVTGELGGFRQAAATDTAGTVFLASIAGAAVVGTIELDEAIFRCMGDCHDGPATLEKLVVKNDAIPDRPGRQLCGFNWLVASNWGIAFSASTRTDCGLETETALNGIFRRRFSTGVLETLALVGEEAESASIVYTGLSRPTIEASGIVAYQAKVEETTPSGTANVAAIYRCGAGCPAAAPEAVVRAGSTDGAGRVFKKLEWPALMSGGNLAFLAKVKEPGLKGVTEAIYRLVGAALEQIIAVDDAAPGVAGYTFSKLSAPAASPGGNIGFSGVTFPAVGPGPKREGVFIFTP